MSDSTTTLTAGTFDEVVNASEKPILVDFWAEWCGPCKMIAPILEEIASEQGEHIQIAKLNVDEAGDIARRFEVMSIPTLIVFDEGFQQRESSVQNLKTPFSKTFPNLSNFPYTLKPINYMP